MITRKKNNVLKVLNILNVQNAKNQMLPSVGAGIITSRISETTLANGIKTLIISFKMHKFMQLPLMWHWNGILGQIFQKLKKLENVVMEPFFVLKQIEDWIMKKMSEV